MNPPIPPQPSNCILLSQGRPVIVEPPTHQSYQMAMDWQATHAFLRQPRRRPDIVARAHVVMRPAAA